MYSCISITKISQLIPKRLQLLIDIRFYKLQKFIYLCLVCSLTLDAESLLGSNIWRICDIYHVPSEAYDLLSTPKWCKYKPRQCHLTNSWVLSETMLYRYRKIYIIWQVSLIFCVSAARIIQFQHNIIAPENSWNYCRIIFYASMNKYFGSMDRTSEIPHLIQFSISIQWLKTFLY